MQRLAAIALVTSVACFLLIAPASSAAAPDDAFGANVQTLMGWGESGLTSAPPVDPYLSALAADGVGVARTDAPWAWVQPTASSQLDDDANWTQLDDIAAAIARNGLRWQPLLDYAPAWAAQTPLAPSGCEPAPEPLLPPADPAQFAAFAGALAQRYGAGGTFWAAHPQLPYLPVTHYEIWNEPNVDVFWNDAPNPAQYVAIYNAARGAIRSVDPAAQVIVGGIVWGGQVDCVQAITNDDDYIAALFAAGGPNWQVDGIAVHPYGPAVLNIVANLRREQLSLQLAGRADVPLEVTELELARADVHGTPQGTDAASYPDDASRAGTVALASDVMMGSDCDVQSLDAYSALEPQAAAAGDGDGAADPYDLVEDWMGIFAPGAVEGESAPATLTSTAYADAIARDVAGEDGGVQIPVCAADVGDGRRLRLGIAVAATGQPGCFDATVSYQGLPIYGAEVESDAPIQPSGATSFGPAFTDLNGQVSFCVGPGVKATVYAVVGGGSFDPSVVPLVARSGAILVRGPAAPARGRSADARRKDLRPAAVRDASSKGAAPRVRRRLSRSPTAGPRRGHIGR